jgi:peptide/nickel transport system permease protein
MLRRYLAKRLVVAIPSLLIASLIVFTLPRLIPGDVVAMMLEEKAYAKDLDELRTKLGLNRPIYVQYFEWVGRAVRGDLGESLWTRQPVLQEIGLRLPITLELALLSLAIALVIAIPIGVISAARQDTLQDYTSRSVAILGLSIPNFWMATLVIVLPAIWWGWRPLTGYVEIGKDPVAHITQMLLPAVILGITFAAALMRLTRGMLLEVLRQDYVRTAWSKGLRERVIILKHGLRNAIIPVITYLGTQLPQVIGGTVVIETIFGLPGMSRFLFDAINQRDYPVIQGINLVVVSFIVLINLGIDALYAVLDPRIRY